MSRPSNSAWRHARMQRFRERWSEFYRDNNDVPAYDIAEPPQPEQAPRSADPRVAYVQQFKHRWSEFQRHEEEDDPLNIIAYFFWRGIVVAAVNIAVYIMDLPHPTQWIITGTVTLLYLIACGVAWHRWKSRTHEEDETL